MADDYVLVLARWMHFSAAMVLFGSSLFPFYVGNLAERAWSPPRSFSFVLGTITLAGASLWLSRYALGLGDPDQLAATIWVILTETSFGVIWTARLSISALLVCAALLSPERVGTGLVAVLAAALLITSGWEGHVVGTVLWGPLNQALHLLMAGFWLGGLIPLAKCVRDARGGTALAVQDAAQALRRYSNLAVLAVMLVALTGAVNVWLILGAPPRLATSYGRALTLKIALVGAMLLLAAFNRFVLMRGLGAPKTERRALARLSGTIALEQVIGAVILLDVSSFGLIDPAN
jgi:putative copper resistance protein D